MPKDNYLEFVNSRMGQSIVNVLGLPNPTTLERYVVGQDFIGGDLLLGAAQGAELIPAIAATLANSSSTIKANSAAVQAAAAVQSPIYSAAEADGQSFKALVFDASGIKNSEQLKALYDFFHPVVRKLRNNGRVIVMARTPELCVDAKQQTAQRALEGFTRSLAKEIRKGGAAQLVYVAPGAESNLESTLRFFLSARSAYVSAQVIRLGPSKKLLELDWHKPLAGKVALVTGASRGIGAAIADTLARDGAHVICLDISGAKRELDEVATRIGGSAIALDVTDLAAPARLVEYFKSEHNGVDIVVHNAGVTRDKTLARMKGAQWDAVININLSSEERINDALLAAGVINRGGRVIGVASISGMVGNVGQTNYATSKAGVIGMVQSMAPILSKRDITINAVAPGFIETQMTAAIPFAFRQIGRRMNSMGQGGLPVDVAETVAWYANPASQGVNGNVVRVCGQSFFDA